MFKCNRVLGFLILLVCLFVGSLAWGQEGARYIDNDKDFSAILPAGWEQKVDYMDTEVIFLSPMESDDDRFQENVTVTSGELSQPLTMDECYQMSLADMRETLKDFKEESSGDMKVDGNDVKFIVYAHKPGDLDLKGISYIIVKGNRVFVVTCAAEHDKFDKYKDVFEQTVQSFKIE